MKERRIKILDPLVASKIAAGEVVERPASVVKELVENSLDAGAASIAVYLAEGGRRLIRVVDDGCGISREEAALAFARNATSKIAVEDDLERISTLGFRGEALYSIASVARVELRTRPKGELAGTLVAVEGVDEPRVRDEGCPEGTTVEVRDLFYNTPARLKFLRSPDSEFSRANEIFKKLALINPQIRFRLMRVRTSGDTSKVVDSPPGSLRERIRDIFGADIARDLMEVSTPFISGFIGRPDKTYSTSKSLHVYVNGRSVRDRSVNRAIIDGYGSLTESNRYPFVVVNISIPPEDVDVNIHPTKSEVRFSSQRAVYDAVKTAVRATLARGGRVGLPAAMSAFAEKGRREFNPSGGITRGGLLNEAPGRYDPSGRLERGFAGSGAVDAGKVGFTEITDSGTVRLEDSKASRGLDFSGGSEDVKNPAFLDLTIVGQLWGEFLIAQSGAGGGDFYIIDQHGAAERCAYETLKKDYYQRDKPRSQMLLLPERIEATGEEAEAIKEAAPYLERLGFDVEPFGPSMKGTGECFLLRAVPEILSTRASGKLVADLAAELSEVGGSSAVEEKIEEILMTIACHSVIRGPRALTREEGDALLRKLAEIDFAAHCPHGRPVVKRYTRKEIETIFKR